MPQLLDLANEILFKIVTGIWLDDIENFAAAFPALSTLMQPTLKKHQRRKKRFGKTDLGEWSNVYHDHPMFFL